MSNFNINESLGFIVGKTSRAMQRHMVRCFAGQGIDLSAEHCIVLLHLHRKDGMTQQEISDSTMTDKTSLTRILNTMEKKGLVVRVADQSDRRVKHVYRTLKAREIQQTMADTAKQLLAKATAGIGSNDLALCKTVLCQVFENLEGERLQFPDNHV